MSEIANDNKEIKIPDELVSERLIIRPVQLKYAEEAYEAMLDGDITKHMAFDAPNSIEDTMEFARGAIAKNQAGVDYVVYVFKKSNGELIGGSGLHHIDTKTPEFGIWIKLDSHGNKYGQETIKTLKKWADDNLDYDYLSYPVVDENIASRKIPESLGGIVHRHYIDKHQNGSDMNLVEYRIYR